jgi:hypothetical protein
VAAMALAYGAEAWGRILQAADRVVVAELLGLMLVVVPSWGRGGDRFRANRFSDKGS